MGRSSHSVATGAGSPAGDLARTSLLNWKAGSAQPGTRAVAHWQAEAGRGHPGPVPSWRNPVWGLSGGFAHGTLVEAGLV